MRKFLLDTNICIYFIKGQFDLHHKIRAVGEENCLLSEVTIAELKYGIENSVQKEKNRKNIEAFIAKFDILPIFLFSTFTQKKKPD